MSKKPHVIIFNVDQWRGDVLGHLGNAAAETPNLDRIVENEGVSFRNAFCQNPVCTPSRCSFMTGWYPHVRGHRTMHYMLHLERNEPNLLKILKDNGYFVWWSFRNDFVLIGLKEVELENSCGLKKSTFQILTNNLQQHKKFHKTLICYVFDGIGEYHQFLIQ